MLNQFDNVPTMLQPPLTLGEQVLSEVAKYVGTGAITSIVTWLLFRYKYKAEAGASDADAAKSYAEAQRQYSDIIRDAYDQIDKLAATCETQRTQLRDLNLRFAREDFLEFEMEWLNSVLKAAEVDLSQYDYLRRKRETKPLTREG